MSKRSLSLISLYYLYVPLCIFLCSWIVSWLGIPLAIILGICPLVLVLKIKGRIVKGKKLIELIIFIILLVWTILSGIGGFVWQNRWDHLFRNAVFLDLVNQSWPVNDGVNLLVYYIGFWLPAALISKLTRLVEIGWYFQFIYGFIGIYLAFRLTMQLVGNVKFRYILPFILFSGIDIIFYFIFKKPIREDYHIELWSDLAIWESNTTLIYWVYNQAIPAWVATMLILNFGKNPGFAPFTICLLLISAPFPAVGLFGLAIFYQIKDGIVQKSIKKLFIDSFNLINVISLIGAIPIILFFSLNSSTGFSFGISNLSITEFTFQFIWLLFIEILIFLPYIFNNIKESPEFWILLFSCVLFLFIQMGNEYGDFNCRVELPLNYFMTYQIILFLKNWNSISKYMKYSFLIIALFATITPFFEISRIIFQTYRKPATEFKSLKYDTVFEFDLIRQNFVADSILDSKNSKYKLSILNLHKKKENKVNQEKNSF